MLVWGGGGGGDTVLKKPVVLSRGRDVGEGGYCVKESQLEGEILGWGGGEGGCVKEASCFEQRARCWGGGRVLF